MVATAVGAIHGIYPWNEPSRHRERQVKRQYYGCDTNDQIARCLACTLPKCENCLEQKKVYTRRTAQSERTKRIIADILKGWEQGLSIKEICAIAQISRTGYYYFLNQMKEGVK